MLHLLRSAGAWLQRLPRWSGALLAGGWLVVIRVLSSRPAGDEPAHFGNTWLHNTGHAPLFGLIALFCIIALPRAHSWPVLRLRFVAGILLFVCAYGVVDELHQSGVAGRDASAFDVVTDVVGASCTLWMASYVGTRRANARGVAIRLALGLVACALAGLAASLV